MVLEAFNGLLYSGSRMEYLTIALTVFPITIVAIIFINSKVKADKNLNSNYYHLLVNRLMQMNTN